MQLDRRDCTRRRWIPAVEAGHWPAAMVALAVAVVMSSCTASDRPASEEAAATTARQPAVVTVPTTTGPPAASTAGRLRDAAAALCTARAAADDRRAARRVFYDRSHDQLHDLARAVQPVGRATAARLLEAKETVEADLDQPDRATRLGDDLDRLIGATGAALRALSIPAPSCAG